MTTVRSAFSWVIHPPFGKSVPTTHIPDTLNEANIMY